MAGAPEVAMRGIKAWLETELPPQQRRNFSIFKCDFFKDGVSDSTPDSTHPALNLKK